MSSKKFVYDDHFQLGVLELMMLDSHFCDTGLSYLKAEYFKNEYYGWFFTTIGKIYEDLKIIPSRIQLKNEILKFPPDRQEKYMMLYRRIVDPQLMRDHQYIRSELTNFCKKAFAWQMNEKLVKNQNKDPDYLFQVIEKAFTEFSHASFEGAKTFGFEDINAILDRSAEDLELIPTYLPTIDASLGGGVPKSTLTVGLSGTNVGKSIWMVNWAYHALMDTKMNNKVFMCTFEGWEEQAMFRLLARATSIPFYRIRRNEFNDLEKKQINAFKDYFHGRIRFYHSGSFGSTVEDYATVCRRVKEEFDFNMWMTDYGQIIGAKKKFDAIRHEQAFVHRALSSLSGEFKAASVTVAQGNRDTQNKNRNASGLIHMDDISECFEICRAAATVITINRSENDQASDRARILLEKQRDGRTNVLEVCKTDFSRLAFYGHQKEGLGYMNMGEYGKEQDDGHKVPPG